MCLRHFGAHQRGQAFKVEAAILFVGEAVAQQRFPAADADQEAQRPQIARQCQQEHFLMIAHQEADRHACAAQREEPIRPPSRIRCAIDQVAEEDEFRPGISARGVVLADRLEQPVEQVEPSMNVADRIDPAPIGDRTDASLPFGNEIEQGPHRHGSAARSLGHYLRKQALQIGSGGATSIAARPGRAS